MINIIVWNFCVGYGLTVCVLCATVSSKLVNVDFEGRVIQLRKINYARNIFFPVFDCVILTAMCLLVWTVTIVYAFRVFRNNNQRVTKQQVWVFLMLASTSLVMNPFMYIWWIHDMVIHSADLMEAPNPVHWRGSPWFDTVMDVMWSSRICGSAVSSMFYLWASAHTYGQHELRTRSQKLRFYVLKLIPIAFYQTLALIANLKYRIVISQLPFVNIASLIAQSLALNRWYKDIVVVVGLLTILEVYIISAIIIRIYTTNKYLKQLDYTKTRSKQIGFRFFVFHNVTYYSLMIVMDIIAATANPKYRIISWLLGYTKKLSFSPSAGHSPAEIMSFVNLAMTAYVHLPCDAHGVMGWFKSTTQKDSVLKEEPLSLLVLEGADSGKSVFDLRVHSRSLVLETHVSMFNFCWLAYTWGKRHDDDNLPINYPSSYGIPEHIRDETTDTNFLIISNEHRIIIAFRGTTSTENLKTDANITTESISKILPSGEKDQEQFRTVLSTPEWKNARIHGGFGEA